MEARDPAVCSFDSPDPETTFALATLLGRAIGARGLAIGLIGPLGAGKTVFVKGLASGLGVDAALVSSPTFVIAQQYFVPEGPEALHHLDLYRLASEVELEGIGFLDWLGPGQVLAVEWLDRFPNVLGAERLEIELSPKAEPVGESGAVASAASEGDTPARRLRARAFGDEPARVLRDWAERVARLEREAGDAGRTPGTVGRPAGRDAIVALLLALVGLGGLLERVGIGSLGGREGVGVRAAAGSNDAFACERLGPWPGEEGRSEAGRGPGDAGTTDDGLGPLRVVCTDAELGDAARAAPSPELAGMARLLDGGRVDANHATRALLENLPGIGATRAAAIVEERQRAPFASMRALERVSGIGPKTREKLETYLQVDSAEPPG